MSKIREIIAQMTEVKVKAENCKPEEREALEMQYASLKKEAEIENIKNISREHPTSEKKGISAQIREAMQTKENPKIKATLTKVNLKIKAKLP